MNIAFLRAVIIICSFEAHFLLLNEVIWKLFNDWPSREDENFRIYDLWETLTSEFLLSGARRTIFRQAFAEF